MKFRKKDLQKNRVRSLGSLRHGPVSGKSPYSYYSAVVTAPVWADVTTLA